jgi:hypothetical protein
MRRVTLVLLIIASIFFFLMLREIGWSKSHFLQQVGYYWPLILVPYAFINLLGAISWKVLLVTRRRALLLPAFSFFALPVNPLINLPDRLLWEASPHKAVRLHADGISWQKEQHPWSFRKA